MTLAYLPKGTFRFYTIPNFHMTTCFAALLRTLALFLFLVTLFRQRLRQRVFDRPLGQHGSVRPACQCGWLSAIWITRVEAIPLNRGLQGERRCKLPMQRHRPARRFRNVSATSISSCPVSIPGVRCIRRASGSRSRSRGTIRSCGVSPNCGTAGAMSHPNIVPIHGADEIDGHVFFVRWRQHRFKIGHMFEL